MLDLNVAKLFTVIKLATVAPVVVVVPEGYRLSSYMIGREQGK